VARNRPAWWKYLLLVLAIAALYLLTARLGLTLALPPEQKATAVWLPSGISLAALLLSYRLWPGVWLGAFLANFWDFFDPSNQFSLIAHILASGGIALGSTLQPLLGTFLLHRMDMGQQSLLKRAENVLRFMGVGVVMCLVAPTIGVTTLYLVGFTLLTDYYSNWWTWWLGDTIGVLIVTPLVLAWREPLELAWRVRQIAEAGLLLVMLLVVGLWVFGGWELWGVDSRFLGYLMVPLLVWTAFRFGRQGATLALVVVMGIAVWGTAQGHGPFRLGTRNESLLLLQTFMGVLAVTTLILAGVLAERKRAEGERARLMVAIEQERATVADVTTARAPALLEERERIAMDIHDGVIQSLYAVALRLSAHERLLDA
jgi:integral membrane sensor domain MASE1